MTITLEIPPDQESRIQAQAQTTGLTVEQWLLHLAKFHSLPGAQHPLQHAAALILNNMSQVPIEALAALPTDGASQHDHYLYSTPKK